MEKVHRELGRYPKWYKAEKDETEKLKRVDSRGQVRWRKNLI